MKVFITGATGFVGRALVSELISSDVEIVATVRNITTELPESVRQIVCDDLSQLSEANSLIDILSDVDVVIHIAARAHVMKDTTSDPLSEYRKMNVTATRELARQAAETGVKRFIFVSSVKVNGESTEHNQMFSENDAAQPSDDYGLSKFEAEQTLIEIGKISSMQVVIIRPPLVYGPGVKANFENIIKLINKGWPLPFGRVHNKRSMIAIDNLIAFIKLCMSHPAAANQLFLIADKEDISTTALLKNIAKAYGVKSILLPVPVVLMSGLAKLLGKKDMADRLFGNLQIDTSKARRILDWSPVITMDAQLEKMADFDKNKK
ncbi:UDP-glucose 4-epimerase family protein [Methylophaga sp.]|uniref:UDP-glucose 4-epimerase family protein n=1 Tax=Methylophaga sp. TaxID=2024840 RepID=UPI003A909F96